MKSCILSGTNEIVLIPPVVPPVVPPPHTHTYTHKILLWHFKWVHLACYFRFLFPLEHVSIQMVMAYNYVIILIQATSHPLSNIQGVRVSYRIFVWGGGGRF